MNKNLNLKSNKIIKKLYSDGYCVVNDFLSKKHSNFLIQNLKGKAKRIELSKTMPELSVAFSGRLPRKLANDVDRFRGEARVLPGLDLGGLGVGAVAPRHRFASAV